MVNLCGARLDGHSYFLEDRGVSLFSRVQGDYFTVLGFPLLDVLEFLRGRGAILS